MSKKLEQALKQVRDLLQEETPEHCVAVSVIFNSKGYELLFQTRSPGSLKRDGITMRNLRGEWVK